MRETHNLRISGFVSNSELILRSDDAVQKNEAIGIIAANVIFIATGNNQSRFRSREPDWGSPRVETSRFPLPLYLSLTRVADSTFSIFDPSQGSPCPSVSKVPTVCGGPQRGSKTIIITVMISSPPFMRFSQEMRNGLRRSSGNAW